MEELILLSNEKIDQPLRVVFVWPAVLANFWPVAISEIGNRLSSWFD